MTEEQYQYAKIGFEKLKEIDLTQEDSYSQTYHLINKYISILIPRLIVQPNLILYRGRINDNCPFHFKSDLSYNPNSNSIKYGRANHLNQSVFYATHKKETALFETSKVVKEKLQGVKENITIGKWIVKRPFIVGAIISDPTFLDKNNEALKLYQTFLKKFPSFQDTKAQELMKAMSDIFAENIDEKEDFKYKISAAFFNNIIETSYREGLPLNGLLFPSVEYEKNDVNIAVIPDIVDNCLMLQNIWTYEVELSENLGTLNPVETCDIQSYKMIRPERPVPNEP
jgi:hypothetical protein